MMSGKKIFQEILTKMSRSITPAIVFMTLLSVAGKKKSLQTFWFISFDWILSRKIEQPMEFLRNSYNIE